MSPSDGALRWVRHALHRHIVRHAHRLTQTGGQLNDLFVSLAEARATLTDGPLPAAAGLPAPPAAAPFPVEGRWKTLGERFGLDAAELALLAVAAAPALDVELARLYAFAWADFTRKQPTVGFVCELAQPGDRAGARAALRADAPLVRHRLIRLADSQAWTPETPRMHRGVVVPDAVLAWLSDEPATDDPAWHAVDAAPGDLLAADGVLDRLDRVLDRGLDAPDRDADTVSATEIADAGVAPPRRTSGTPSLSRLGLGDLASPPPHRHSRPGHLDGPLAVLLVGAPGAGRRSASHAALARRGRPMYAIDLAALPLATFGDALADALRDARLRGAVPFLRGDELFDDAERSAPLVPIVRKKLKKVTAIIAARQPVGGLRVLDPIEIRFEALTAPQQLELWRRVLASPEMAEPLVERFSMPPGAIVDALRVARHEVRLGGADAAVEPDIDALSTAVRRRISHALDVVAEPVSTTLTWDDVVLPDDVMATLREISAQARHRSQVYDGWGFRQKVAYGRGLACLFAGPPGTGKTMMATIMAAELGRELYRVDLSRVVSKWVGETEKNLSRVFDEAEKAQIILFFDEADSLFSTRTEVKGSNDRFANMEVNYLLQRMEQFDGMSILTTNFERGLDEAFKRRLKFRVQFPLPDTEQRAELWKRCIPDAMPREDDIRWSHLGRKYKLSGGNIKNAVVRAAFYAASGEGLLTERLLLKAAEAEMREMGRL